MWFKVSLIVCAVAVSGCVTAITDTLRDVKPQHDISTGSETAIIRGSEKGVMEPQTCHIYQPVSTMELLTDAGKVSLLAKCFGYGTYGRSGAVYAGVEFTAEAGHAYLLGHQFETSYRTIDLIDVSDSNRLVIRRPLMFIETYAAESSSKAVVISGIGSDTIRCTFLRAAEPLVGDQFADLLRRHRHPVPSFYENEYTNLLLAPGQVTFTARCLKFGKRFGGKTRVKLAYKADISFEVESGHLYKIDINIKRPECAQVTDISRDELPITCVPATQIDELLGLTTSELRDH